MWREDRTEVYSDNLTRHTSNLKADADAPFAAVCNATGNESRQGRREIRREITSAETLNMGA